MRLILIRHAKSSWGSPQLDDFDRVLNQRGQSDLPIMQEQLLQRVDPAEFKVVSSSAVRTKLTCEGLGLKAEYRDNIYLAAPDTLMDLVREFKGQDLIIVCHNPGITDFANRLCNVRIDNVPTLGMSFIELSRAEYGVGELKEFIYPRRFK